MTRKVDWTNVAGGLLIALAVGATTRWMAKNDSVTVLQTQAGLMPDRRDREIDQMLARISALEARCRE